MSKTEIKRLVTAFRKGFLRSGASRDMCFALCFPLSGYLTFLGVENRLERVSFPHTEHDFIRLADGDILDPTADQFDDAGLPKVYLGPMPEIYQKWIKASNEYAGTGNRRGRVDDSSQQKGGHDAQCRPRFLAKIV